MHLFWYLKKDDKGHKPPKSRKSTWEKAYRDSAGFRNREEKKGVN